MDVVGSLQGWVVLVLGVAAFGLTAFAAIDAARRRADLFTAVGRLTKPAWMAILVVACLISFVSLGGYGALGLLNVIAVIAAGVYLADVRPKIRQISGGGRGGSGPYGPY